MKINILDKEGKKVREIESRLFEEPIREDIIRKVVEAERIWQPYSSRFRAGMDRSASGLLRRRRHVWKASYGRGISRVPRKIMSRRGTQFSWEGAIIPSVKGGRRAHPPKKNVNLKKINKKEFKKALLSSLHYISSVEDVKKKYSSLNDKEIKLEFPLVVESEILELNTVEFFKSIKKILGNLYGIAIQNKSVRAGIGKMRGRKYKKNAGLLFIVGRNENKKVRGIEIVNVDEISVSDLAGNGARLTIFSENAVEDLGRMIEGKNKINEDIESSPKISEEKSHSRDDKNGSKSLGDIEIKDRRKIKKMKVKKINDKKLARKKDNKDDEDKNDKKENNNIKSEEALE